MQFLQTDQENIRNESGEEIRLRGTSVGGWMNMEDFINGYSGSEHTLRYTFREMLGERKASFFFQRLLDHFFNEEDIRFLKKIGLNVVRLPLNYRHFEDDARPFRYREEGFARLDHIIDLCEKHELYVILDMHAVQGWQNAHWHSDNDARHSFFWDVPHYQERFIALWKEMARRYKDRAVVAGYNIMNEPCVNTPHGDFLHNFFDRYRPRWDIMNDVYKRTVNAIREVDPKHIIFLEGDRYSSLFHGLEEPFADNLVYSSHNYTQAGFGPGPYPGNIYRQKTKSYTYWDKAKQVEAFEKHEGTVFTRKHRVPLWVGEFGSVYNGPKEEIPDRIRAIDDQIAVFEENGVHWTTWTYKDVGVMGLAMLNKHSKYMELIADFIEKKQKLGTDDWMSWLPETEAQEALRDLNRYMADTIDDEEFDADSNFNCLSRAALSVFAGAAIQPFFVKKFKEMSEEQLDDILQSFRLEQCDINRDLLAVYEKYVKE